MVKILYTGDITPCRIKVLSSIFTNWKRGEVRDLTEKDAEKLINDNKNFSYTNGTVKKQEEKKVEKPIEEKKKVKFDLDGDGDVDSDDYTIAAKTLSHARKSKQNV